jgi:leucine dehydrogenase
MSIWESAEFDDHEQVCMFTDPVTGLRAIIAVHATIEGRAAGGTRFKPYDTTDAAVDDALRLSRAMSYKSALAGLPLGGGKGVIIGDPTTLKTPALLESYARFVDRLGGTFRTGEDVGTSVADMELMSSVSRHIGGTDATGGDPSVPTAAGVLIGLRAVAAHRFGQVGFKGLRVAVQGLGSVGWRVAEGLRADGADLVVADIVPERVSRAQQELGATVCDTAAIHGADVDIYAPCALGHTVTIDTAAEIRARAVAGAANNPLATAEAGMELAKRGILFTPDYVINAGGIIGGWTGYQRATGQTTASVEEKLAGIGNRLTEIFERSATTGERPEQVAEHMARVILGRI